MKVSGKGPQVPIDFVQASNSLKNRSEVSGSEKSAAGDKVDARLSQVLSSITAAIAESGLTAGQLHSEVDENRLQHILDSFDRVEAKRPEVDWEKVLQLADSLQEEMVSDPEAAIAAFKKPNPERVADLLSS